MKLNRLPCLMLAASLLITPSAQAAGMLVIDPVAGMPPGALIMPIHPIVVRPHPGTPTPRPISPMLHGAVSFGLHMQAAEVSVEINDQVAKTYITQTFVNETDRNLAGTYLFPLPDDTTFSSFSLHIDGRPVEGKILEANEARTEYENIVRSMVDPGLLEYADYKTVRARIFPIPAHGTKKVQLEYTQVLKAENGLLKYRFPLKTENDSAPADELKVDIKLASKQGLRTIWSPSHTISVKKTNDHLAKVAYLEKTAVPDKDFLLYYSVSDKELTANVLTHKSADEDGYYMLTLSPPVEAKQVSAKDIMLVVDTSGSMAGARLEQSKAALKYLVNALNPGDRFNIVQFNTDVDQFKGNIVSATAENKQSAEHFIDDLEARGGTNIGDALHSAVGMLGSAPSDRPAYLVLMTDGEPTVGETSVAGLLKTLASKRDLRVFDFGVGYDINTQLLNKLAENHHGTAEYVEPGENLETALSGFYQKIKSPVLSNVHIAYDGVATRDVYPKDVQDIFAGSQVLLIGKYKGSGKSTVRLTGTINGVQKAYSFPVSFSPDNSGNTYLPRLWAMRRIGHLTEVAQDNGNTKEVVDEVIALSKKYGIISQYTSFLVTDPNERNAHNMPVGAMMPQMQWTNKVASFTGVSGFGVAGGAGGSSISGIARGGLRNGGMTNAQLDRGIAVPSAAPSPLPQTMASPRQYADVFMKKSSSEAFDAVSSTRVVGRDAVLRQKELSKFKDTVALADNKSDAEVKTVDDKTFFMKDGFWTDSSYDGKQNLSLVSFGSKEYFDLLKSAPGIGKYLSAGRQLILIFNGQGYKVTFGTQT